MFLKSLCFELRLCCSYCSCPHCNFSSLRYFWANSLFSTHFFSVLLIKTYYFSIYNVFIWHFWNRLCTFSISLHWWYL